MRFPVPLLNLVIFLAFALIGGWWIPVVIELLPSKAIKRSLITTDHMNWYYRFDSGNLIPLFEADGGEGSGGDGGHEGKDERKRKWKTKKEEQ
ncbi:hypothetical protein PVK06_029539 [Gossypium arboreum]|uniref:Transmembrane protein n=1 Tax=Gossypium arboreum TaxID=29729 RepID=A0ABR0P708_GOSAR|nr:hypothetical protein PVK06_029539 [Gossypium arboreum]